MRIRWTDPALRDFTQICDYIERHGSAGVARRVSISIYGQISDLFRFPELGRTGRKPETRELVLSGLPYIAIYRVQVNEIQILRLLHGAQQWP
ncbi:MAG TPA: type II toxin-antitoxin system RelE/ParE family toxin [Terriglobales bacterium]|jgi:toxin ParE1/3/4